MATEPFSLSEMQTINVNGLRCALALFFRVTISEVNGKCPLRAELLRILQQQQMIKLLVVFHLSLENINSADKHNRYSDRLRRAHC